MGNFYANITLRGPAQEQIMDLLKQLRKRAYVSPNVGGFTVLCEEQCDTQETGIIHVLASSLSARLACPALAVLNHDDDVLWYRLYDQGRMVDEYDSAPGYFDGTASKPNGGNARLLCELMGSSKTGRAAAVLRKSSGWVVGYTFAVQRHEDLLRALDMPAFGAGLGYEYLERGELPPGLKPGDLKRTW